MNKFWASVCRAPEGEGGEAPAPTPDPAPVVPQQDDPPQDEPPAPAAPAISPGVQARIGQLTRKNKELEAQLVTLSQQLQAPPTPEEVSNIDPAQATRALELEIDRRAAAKAQQQDWLNRTNRVWEDGMQKHPDWAAKINGMAALMGEIPRTLTEAAMAAGNPVDVLHHLASDPDKAIRLASMTPTQQAVEVAKLAQELSGGTSRKSVSNAPPPVTPRVNGQGTVVASLDDPKLSMDEWYRLRQEQVKARRGRR